MALLELTGLSITAAGRRPIAGLDLTLAEGGALAIVGRAGSGKTLLARAIAGLLPTGAAAEGTGLGGKRIGLLGPDADITELARWLDRGIDLLIGDEPGRALAPEAQRELLAALHAANREHRIGLLILTRDFRLPLVMQLETAVLSGGKLIERGSAEALSELPAETATRELVAAIKPRTRTLARPPIGEPVLELRGVGRRFPDPTSRLWRRKPPIAALDDITLSVRRGEAVGLLGGAGAGKSLLLRLAAGQGRTSAGQLAFDRVPHRGGDMRREARVRIGMLFPDPHAAFNPDLPVGLSLTEPLRVEEQLLIDEQADRLVEAVRVVGLAPDRLDSLPSHFSPAELQRLALARALVGRPSLILLDEPTARLDPVEQAEFLVLFNRVRSDYGLTVFCGSREFEVLRLVADRILVLERGRLVEGGKPSELSDAAQHPATRALLAARYPAPATAAPPTVAPPPAEPPPVAAAPVLDDSPDKAPESGQVEPTVDGTGDGAGSVEPADIELAR